MLVDHRFDFRSESALSESISKSVCFSRDLQCQLGPVQLGLELLGAPTQLLQLHLLRSALGPLSLINALPDVMTSGNKQIAINSAHSQFRRLFISLSADPSVVVGSAGRCRGGSSLVADADLAVGASSLAVRE